MPHGLGNLQRDIHQQVGNRGMSGLYVIIIALPGSKQAMCLCRRNNSAISARQTCKIWKADKTYQHLVLFPDAFSTNNACLFSRNLICIGGVSSSLCTFSLGSCPSDWWLKAAWGLGFISLPFLGLVPKPTTPSRRKPSALYCNHPKAKCTTLLLTKFHFILNYFSFHWEMNIVIAAALF